MRLLLGLVILILCVVTSSAAIGPTPNFGDPLAWLTPDEQEAFEEGQEEFAEVDGVENGLGPSFNEAGCGVCHSNPAVGGDSATLETRVMTRSRGTVLVHAFGIAPCGPETIPPDATVVTQRKTTPLFGAGQIANIPDAALMMTALFQRFMTPAVAGRPHIVVDVASGQRRVGRFGWKAQVATLKTFAGDAYVNEMGITSPLFPVESMPDNDPVKYAACDTMPEIENDGTAVEAFANFMTLLAPPPRGAVTRDALLGETLFGTIGCDTCHVRGLRADRSETVGLDRAMVRAFSDFLLHDMGSLGDGIRQGNAGPREMRTAPLWGLRVRETFLHDGRCDTLPCAIAAHAGQGSAARDAFAALSASDRARLLAFLRSL